MSIIARIFTSNKSQAVRLPKSVAFPEGVTEVEVVVVGESRIVSPVGHRWDAFFSRPDKVSDDFERGDQGTIEEREPL